MTIALDHFFVMHCILFIMETGAQCEVNCVIRVFQFVNNRGQFLRDNVKRVIEIDLNRTILDLETVQLPKKKEYFWPYLH